MLNPPTKEIVKSRVIEHINTQWASKVPDLDRCTRFLRPAIDLATIGYGHIHIDAQVHIALHIMLTLCVDDFGVSDEALDSFQAKLLNRALQLDPVLDLLVDSLSHMPDYFPSYACKGITLSAIAHVDATLYDKQHKEEVMDSAALPYVHYKRLRTGLGEVFAYFIWDKFSFPDMSVYVKTTP
jgi:hypothetical protein